MYISNHDLAGNLLTLKPSQSHIKCQSPRFSEPRYIPYACHYNPWFVYFLPTFWSSFMYCDLWPYVWLVFKSGFKSRAGYSGARMVFNSSPTQGYCLKLSHRVSPHHIPPQRVLLILEPLLSFRVMKCANLISFWILKYIFFPYDYFGDQSTCLSEEIKHLFPSSYILGELSIFSAREIAQGVAWHYFLTRA